MNAVQPGILRYRADELEAFAHAVLVRAGLAPERAADVAAVLVEGDCLGKPTHGLALLPPYLREIATGGMTLTGEPEVVNDFGACLTWTGASCPAPGLSGVPRRWLWPGRGSSAWVPSPSSAAITRAASAPISGRRSRPVSSCC